MPKAYTHQEFCDIIFAKYDWIKEVKGTYVNSRTPIEIECINGHVLTYDPKKLTKTDGIKNCPTCREIKYSETREQYESNPKLCARCGKPIPYNTSAAYTRSKKFCSQTCAVLTLNESKKIASNKVCLFCGKEIPRHNEKYCSVQCQRAYERKNTN